MNYHFNIVGAGIGGLTTALILKQKGYSFTVFEGADEIKPVGAGIVLAINAMQILDQLGLYEKVEAAGNRISAAKITDHKLKPLSYVDLKRFEVKYGVSNVAIHRGDLQQLLANEVGLENIHLSKRLLNIENTGHKGHILSFEDGSNVNANILIGADGIKSIVRNQLYEQATLRYAKQICWRGICEINLPDQYDNVSHEAWGKGKRFGFVKINKSNVYWFALINDKKDKLEGRLFEIFREFHQDILSIIKATPVANIIKNEIADLKPFYKWHTENSCLIGDAAHATTPNLGQGACQAIEDAYALGNFLTGTTNIQTAFNAYEKSRQKKAHMIVDQSWKIGKIAQIENNFGIWLRNNLVKSIPESSSRNNFCAKCLKFYKLKFGINIQFDNNLLIKSTR